jgi:uncharacterized damage-inducible protein DinB
MSETLKSMEIFTKFGLQRLRWITENVDDELFDWKITRQSNSIRWVLSHISIILNVFFPRAITGNLNYYPPELPRKYLDNLSLSIKRIQDDIEYGELKVLEQLGSLDEEKLQESLDWYLGPHEREFYLMLLSSEILHHGGQIAAILGNWRRNKSARLNSI